MWGPVDDLETWIIQQSQGHAPFRSYQGRGFDPALVDLIKLFQFGGLSDAV